MVNTLGILGIFENLLCVFFKKTSPKSQITSSVFLNFKKYFLKYYQTTLLRVCLIVILKSFLIFKTFENFYQTSIKKVKNIY